MSILESAITTAFMAHSGQTDEDGLPHIVHSMAVMLRVQDEWDTRSVEGYELEEILAAAVLHDVAEDTKVTLDMIRVKFGDKIADVVDAVSRRKDESYRDFIYRAKANSAARLIKIADLMHNRSRTHKISEKKASWRKKLEYKYRIASSVLNDSYEPTWEGASYESQLEILKETKVPGGTKADTVMHYFIADPNGKRIEITRGEADNVKISFRISN